MMFTTERTVELLYVIKNFYSKEWNSSWKFNTLLGNACNITLRYDERFEAYTAASKMVNPIPPSLLVLLAQCYISPGTPPLSQDEAENLLKEALSQEKIIEGISLIKRIYERKGDLHQTKYWNTILANADSVHIHDVQPDFLNRISLD